MSIDIFGQIGLDMKINNSAFDGLSPEHLKISLMFESLLQLNKKSWTQNI